MTKQEIVDRIKENFPQALRNLDQWATWRIEARDGKPTKVPYNATTGDKAKSNQPSTWATFEQACHAYLNDRYDGIGFMFSEFDPYAGVDFDDCVGAYRVIDTEKASYVGLLNSYSEFSQSVTGIHTIVMGTLPEGGRKSNRHSIEMYDRLRFFVVTGDILPKSPRTIEQRQAELEDLHKRIFPAKPKAEQKQVATNHQAIPNDDRALIDRMFGAKNGTDIRLLWSGDTSAYNNDESAADLALCNHLAFWTGNDAGRIDRLFRQSGLMRPKWDRAARTEDGTYGQGTINRAIAATTTVYVGQSTGKAGHRSYNGGNGVHNGTASHVVIESVDDGPPDYSSAPAPWINHDAGNGHEYMMEPVPLPDVNAAPPLPKYARLTEEEIAESMDTGEFLRGYAAFSRESSPMTPPEFHVAAGLSMASIAIARRLHVRVGQTKIYPNLYQFYIGPSTLQRKTTAQNTMINVMVAAGMIPMFTLAERQTPEAFVEDLSTNLPASYDRMNETARTTWLERRRFYAQRGWILDEAAHLLDSFNRDYTSGLLPIVLDLYDSKDRSGERNTRSWGNESIFNSYLNIFGATTYAAMSKHMSNNEHWNNGLFARFSFVACNDPGTWQFWPSPTEIPGWLVGGINRIAFGLFGHPPSAMVRTVEQEDDKTGKPKDSYRTVEVEPLNDTAAHISRDAWIAWERYSKAVGHDMLTQAMNDKSLPEDFFPNYGRFGTMMMKVAMIFAAMDATQTPITIERKHIFAAQHIVENWRNSLHIVQAGGQKTAQATATDKVLAVLAQNGENWTLRRDLLRAVNCAWSDIETTIDDLCAAEKIERMPHQTRGPATEKYRVLV